jgi:hypothetical protein
MLQSGSKLPSVGATRKKKDMAVGYQRTSIVSLTALTDSSFNGDRVCVSVRYELNI